MKVAAAQKGLHLVEFAVAGMAFFVLLIAVVEFGRLLFTWHALDEVARRGARVAAVCPVGDPAIARVAVFNGPTTSGNSPVLPTLSDSQVSIQYLDASGNPLASPAGSYDQIRFVRASISGFSQTLMIPLATRTLQLPTVSAVLPRESLGVSPSGVGCF